MKKIYFLLTLIMSVTTLQLSAQDTLTVANGTMANSNIPVYGYYMDYQTRSQMIFPGNLLDDMVGSTISSITFYLASSPTVEWTTTFDVRLGTCQETTFPSNDFLLNPTQSIYSGTLTVANGKLTVTFSTPFLYSGGNLLMEFASLIPGNYSSASFYGITSNNSSISGTNLNDISAITPTRRNFLPKTTFVYNINTAACQKPTAFSVSNITTQGAMLTWTPDGNESSWDLYITESDAYPNANATPTISVTDTFYSITTLTSATTYYAYVRANCGTQQSSWKALSFQTLCDSIAVLPFFDGFDTYGTGTGAYPICWYKINTYTTGERPYINSTN